MVWWDIPLSATLNLTLFNYTYIIYICIKFVCTLHNILYIYTARAHQHKAKGEFFYIGKYFEMVGGVPPAAWAALCVLENEMV